MKKVSLKIYFIEKTHSLFTSHFKLLKVAFRMKEKSKQNYLIEKPFLSYCINLTAMGKNLDNTEIFEFFAFSFLNSI